MRRHDANIGPNGFLPEGTPVEVVGQPWRLSNSGPIYQTVATQDLKLRPELADQVLAKDHEIEAKVQKVF